MFPEPGDSSVSNICGYIFKFCFHTALFEHLKHCAAVQKYDISEMSQISLFQFCVTGQCEPSACVRLKPSPRQTLF